MKKLLFVLLLIPALAFPQRRWSQLISSADTAILADLTEQYYLLCLDQAEAANADKNKLLGLSVFDQYYATLTGATFTGNLITNGYLQVNENGSSANAEFYIESDVGYQNLIRGRRGGVNRWAISLGSNTAESGSNAGSNFAIYRYDDAGSYINAPLSIWRSSGVVSMANGLNVNGGTANIVTADIATVYADSILASADVPKFPDGLRFDEDTLSVYETGTWTPQVWDALTGGNSDGATTQYGNYTKIGNVVFFSLQVENIDVSNFVTAGTTAQVLAIDIPFTAISTIYQTGTVTTNEFSIDTNNTWLTYFIPPDGDRLYLIENGADQTFTSIRINQLNDDSDDLYVQGFYLAN